MNRARYPITLPCDLCNAPFVLPRAIAAQDEITGLLVCEACIEAELSARTCEAVFEGVRA